jgi:hypothetical protein
MFGSQYKLASRQRLQNVSTGCNVHFKIVFEADRSERLATRHEQRDRFAIDFIPFVGEHRDGVRPPGHIDTGRIA